MSDLTNLLVETGIVQFGRFQHPTSERPFLLSLEYLPAYPEVLKRITQTIQTRFEQKTAQRLVATTDAIPLGVALALNTGISLVYSRGQGQEAVYDLVGAYNIGHTAVLLTNVLENTAELSTFITMAQRVGLEIHTVLAVLDLGIGAALPGVQIKPLLTLSGIVQALLADKRLPSGQAHAVLTWIDAQHNQANLRPDAASP
ncbi:MAG TPA: hypothetical protein VHO69_00460 [Phototrophicaceae bacterium]|nr:hypothetical protein [Phototrophicaceae bacterium]